MDGLRRQMDGWMDENVKDVMEKNIDIFDYTGINNFGVITKWKMFYNFSCSNDVFFF